MPFRRIGLIFAIAQALIVPAAAQYIAPHSNDPHPPANQPAYQLPTPLNRPGVPQYPGAPHSNDPHYRKTEPDVRWPPPAMPAPNNFPSIDPRLVRPPVPSYTPRAGRGAHNPKVQQRKTISLEQCYRNWDAGTRMSRSSWNETCRRLSSGGQVRIR